MASEFPYRSQVLNGVLMQKKALLTLCHLCIQNLNMESRHNLALNMYKYLRIEDKISCNVFLNNQ